MPIDVHTEAVIHAPPEVVAAAAADPDRATEWYANIERVEWLTPPPLAAGTRLAFVARFLGRRLAYTYEVTELELPRRMVMRTADGPFPMETTYGWEGDGRGGTRMTLRNRGEPSGFGRLAGLLMGPAVRRANRRDLARLARLVEGA
jgi:Polyketide cyclase / dehydrase and lipid transport